MWDCGIWSTMPYSLEEMIQIVSIRAETETIDVDEEALAYMVCGRYVCMVVWCFAGATSVSFFRVRLARALPSAMRCSCWPRRRSSRRPPAERRSPPWTWRRWTSSSSMRKRPQSCWPRARDISARLHSLGFLCMDTVDLKRRRSMMASLFVFLFDKIYSLSDFRGFGAFLTTLS